MEEWGGSSGCERMRRCAWLQGWVGPKQRGVYRWREGAVGRTRETGVRGDGGDSWGH